MTHGRMLFLGNAEEYYNCTDASRLISLRRGMRINRAHSTCWSLTLFKSCEPRHRPCMGRSRCVPIPGATSLPTAVDAAFKSCWASPPYSTITGLDAVDGTYNSER